MLVAFHKLVIINEGYKRTYSLNKIYVNPAHIISVRDYQEASDFLMTEGASNLVQKKFSLIKINNASCVEEVIVSGHSEEIYKLIKSPDSKDNRGILNG